MGQLEEFKANVADVVSKYSGISERAKGELLAALGIEFDNFSQGTVLEAVSRSGGNCCVYLIKRSTSNGSWTVFDWYDGKVWENGSGLTLYEAKARLVIEYPKWRALS